MFFSCMNQNQNNNTPAPNNPKIIRVSFDHRELPPEVCLQMAEVCSIMMTEGDDQFAMPDDWRARIKITYAKKAEQNGGNKSRVCGKVRSCDCAIF